MQIGYLIPAAVYLNQGKNEEGSEFEQDQDGKMEDNRHLKHLLSIRIG